VLYRGKILATGEPLDHTERISHMSYVQPVAALVFDNSLFGWTGPIDGRRYRAQYSRTIGTYALSEALLDFRNYFNIKQKVVFAARVVGLARSGDDSERFGVYWGGPYYLRGYDANSFNLDSNECSKSRLIAADASLSRCPVRDQLIGSSTALVNLEMRVPLIKELQIGGLGTFPPIDFVTFVDGGLAWDNEICLRATSLDPRRCDAGQAQQVHVVWQRKEGQDPFLWRQPLFSYGAGLRINIFYTILRLDYAIPMDRPDRQGFRNGVFSLSFGPSF
jgi:outer membrane protein assembly factor BamA